MNPSILQSLQLKYQNPIFFECFLKIIWSPPKITAFKISQSQITVYVKSPSVLRLFIVLSANYTLALQLSSDNLLIDLTWGYLVQCETRCLTSIDLWPCLWPGNLLLSYIEKHRNEVKVYLALVSCSIMIMNIIFLSIYISSRGVLFISKLTITRPIIDSQPRLKAKACPSQLPSPKSTLYFKWWYL